MAFVEMLKVFRALDLRFGFLSDQRGKDAGSYGRSEAAALIAFLDELLRIDGATPDFWMAWHIPHDRSEIEPAREGQPGPLADMILRALRQYQVDKENAVFVSSSLSSLVAATNVDITGTQFSARPSDRRNKTLELGPPRNVTEIRHLEAMIQETLGKGHLRRA